MLYSLAFARDTYGQIQFGVTPAGSATRAVPPGTAGAVAEEAGAAALAETDEPVQPAIPSASSAPAPTAAAAARRVRRLFPTINALLGSVLLDVTCQPLAASHAGPN